MLKPPRLAFRRCHVWINRIQPTDQRIDPQTQVFLPEIFHLYELSEFLPDRNLN